MDYRVHLDVYDGPLDLLLYLIRRDELEIFNIPISRITGSYLQFLDGLRSAGTLDLNEAGDFVVMAATLMDIKSRSLLPPADPRAGGGADGSSGHAADALTDPRQELVMRLLEYKHFKETATQLHDQALSHGMRFKRLPGKGEGATDEPPPLDLDEVQVWDLLGAFSKLMREVGHRAGLTAAHEVVYDDTPLDDHARNIEAAIAGESGTGRITLRKLIIGKTSRSQMIGVFLAILELVRQKRLLVSVGEVGNDTASEVFVEVAPASAALQAGDQIGQS